MSRKPRTVQSAENPDASPGPVKAVPRVLRLYVARPTPSSSRAEANLAAVLATMAEVGSTFRVEFVDVIQNPHQAVKDRIIVTPCLVVVGTNPPETLIDELQDPRVLRLFLERAVGRTA